MTLLVTAPWGCCSAYEQLVTDRGTLTSLSCDVEVVILFCAKIVWGLGGGGGVAGGSYSRYCYFYINTNTMI